MSSAQQTFSLRPGCYRVSHESLRTPPPPPPARINTTTYGMPPRTGDTVLASRGKDSRDTKRKNFYSSLETVEISSLALGDMTQQRQV